MDDTGAREDEPASRGSPDVEGTAFRGSSDPGDGARDGGEDGEGVALVMLGGGARAAYQVGFLRCLARRMPEVRFPIFMGVSSGAINAAHLASRCDAFPEAVNELAELWAGLTSEKVMRTGTLSLLRNVLLWGLRLVSGGGPWAPEVRGLVDCAPLRTLLGDFLAGPDGPIEGIDRNVEAGRLHAVALATTSYTSGQSVTWIHGCDVPESWERAGRRGVCTKLTVDHVMASAALPMIFPAVSLDGEWYGDGAVRLPAPLFPAIQLGADRILAVSTHHSEAGTDRERRVVDGYPPLAQVVGTVFGSVFLDALREDARRLERINALLRECPGPSATGLRPVDLFVMRPSRDLAELAGDYEKTLPWAFRFMTRGLGTRETRSPDFLSLVLFEPGYLRLLMELGEEDAWARADELEAFLRGE